MRASLPRSGAVTTLSGNPEAIPLGVSVKPGRLVRSYTQQTLPQFRRLNGKRSLTSRGRSAGSEGAFAQYQPNVRERRGGEEEPEP